MSAPRRRGRVATRRMVRPHEWNRLQVGLVLAMFALAMLLVVVRLATYG